MPLEILNSKEIPSSKWALLYRITRPVCVCISCNRTVHLQQRVLDLYCCCCCWKVSLILWVMSEKKLRSHTRLEQDFQWLKKQIFIACLPSHNQQKQLAHHVTWWENFCYLGIHSRATLLSILTCTCYLAQRYLAISFHWEGRVSLLNRRLHLHMNNKPWKEWMEDAKRALKGPLSRWPMQEGQGICCFSESHFTIAQKDS